MRRFVLSGRLVLCFLLLALAASCSSESEPVAAPAFDPDAPAPSAQFCARGNAFVTATDVRLVAAPTADTFASIDTRLAELEGEARDDVADSIATLRSGFGAVGDAYANVGYDPAGTIILDPEVRESNLEASSRLRSYLLARCELAALEDAQIDEIVVAFGLDDREIGRCFHGALGDVANIDSSSLTPDLMTTEVCGTSLLEALG